MNHATMLDNDTPLTLYYYPFACSLAVHIVLEETGLPYERAYIDIKAGGNRTADYLAVNPKGTVPTLRFGDRVITEAHAIMTLVADAVPEMQLIPAPGDPQRYRAHEWMNFLSSTVHPYIRSIFRPGAYAGDDASICEAVRRQGHKNLATAVDIIEHRLGSADWSVGDRFSVCDAYLFIMYLWSCDARIDAVPERPRWDANARRTFERPAARRAVAFEQEVRKFSLPSGWT